ncbi:unnamed protein product, partial [Amoebophrya sp. A25]
CRKSVHSSYSRKTSEVKALGELADEIIASSRGTDRQPPSRSSTIPPESWMSAPSRSTTVLDANAAPFVIGCAAMGAENNGTLLETASSRPAQNYPSTATSTTFGTGFGRSKKAVLSYGVFSKEAAGLSSTKGTTAANADQTAKTGTSSNGDGASDGFRYSVENYNTSDTTSGAADGVGLRD